MKTEQLTDIRIIRIKAANIYYKKKHNIPLVIENNKYGFNPYFCDLMPPNLDLYYLRDQGKLRTKTMGDEQYTYDYVNVSFDRPLYTDNKGKQVDLDDKEDRKLWWDKVKELNVVEAKVMREDLYLNGFVLNGKEYVRYKRSSGSAKAGSCLFIRKDLYAMMNRWSKCGLDLDESKDNCLQDLTSYEAYKALSLSSLIATLDLNPYNILIVPEPEVTLKNQKVIRVSYTDKEKGLEAEEAECDIKNKIFDGEGLLDVSVFKENGFSKKGMMLLRSRFFKCCAFNTNLQQWLKDNNITDVSQLHGWTLAKNIEDIVLVASDTCLKYFKMAKGKTPLDVFKRWCDEVSKDVTKFGIVKTDKPTRFFNGEMAETTYQFLNSLQLSAQKDLNTLLQPYIDYISNIRNLVDTPEFIRFHLECEELNGQIDHDDDSEQSADEEVLKQTQDYSTYSYKNKVCLDLATINGETIHTNLFKKRVYESIVDSLFFKLYSGRVLVNGTTATLFGNPYEFLNYILLNEEGKPKFDKDNPTSLLNEGEIYSPFFEDGQYLVGERSPHTTMGNVLYVKNKKLPIIKKYFNLTKQIVVVDAVNNNIQQRLSGCDYDSDFVLLTDNPVLVKAASRNYNKFLVPYIGFEPTNKSMDKSLSDNKKEMITLNLCKTDNAIANNIVGKIVNLSQLLNSHLWTNYNSLRSKYDYKPLYNKIAALCVLSGAEIDSSKRNFPFEPVAEYNRIKNYAIKEGFYKKKPLFFTMLSKNKNHKPSIKKIKEKRNEVREFGTSMDYLWEKINQVSLRSPNNLKTISLFDFFKEGLKGNPPGDVYNQVKRVVEVVLVNTDQAINDINSDEKIEEYETRKLEFNNVMQSTYEDIKHNINTLEKVKLMIKKLEEKDDGYSKLFILLYIIKEHEAELPYRFKDLLPKDSVPLPTLVKPVGKQKADYILFGKYQYKIKNFRGTFKI